MKRLFFPILLLGAAIGLFAWYTNPIYQESKAIQVQVKSYDDALTKSQELRSLRDQLLSRRNTFSPEDINKLQEILPDNVDNIRLIININNIAARHGITLKDVQLGQVSGTSQAQSAAAVGQSGSPVGSVTLGFTVTATYADFLIFLADLEHSLRILDVEKLSFHVDSTTKNDYALTIRTYWLH